jgi:hypothetical protein
LINKEKAANGFTFTAVSGQWHNFTVENVLPGTGSVEIPVAKEVNTNVNLGEYFVIQAVLVDENGSPITDSAVKITNASTSNLEVNLSELMGINIEGLKAGGTYYFEISESKTNVIEEWIYSDAIYTVSVEVDFFGNTTVSYGDAETPLAFRNTMPGVDLGSLELTKNVEGGDDFWLYYAQFQFLVTFISDMDLSGITVDNSAFESNDGGITWSGLFIPSGRSVRFDGIPKDTEYIIAEASSDYYTVISHEFGMAFGIIGEDDIYEFTEAFVNRMIMGSLELTKEVEGGVWPSPSDAQFNFNIEFYNMWGLDLGRITVSDSTMLTPDINGVIWTWEGALTSGNTEGYRIHDNRNPKQPLLYRRVPRQRQG